MAVKGEIDVGSPITEIKTYGTKLRVSHVVYQAGANAVLVKLESFDGTAFSGKAAILRIDSAGAVFTDLDGSATEPAKTVADVAAFIDLDGLAALVDGLRSKK